MASPSTVLVPSLDTTRDVDLLEYTCETFPNADVTVLAIVTPIDNPLSEGRILERRSDRIESARSRTRSLVETAAVDTDRVAVAIVQGRPSSAIPAYARDHGFDHIVVRKATSHRWLRTLLGRDVGTTVAHRSSVPVTLVE